MNKNVQTCGRTGVRLKARAGMTLIEMMIAMVVFSIVIAATLSTIEGESKAFRIGSQRMTLLQNLRFAINALEQDLRVAGSNVPAAQPDVVYIDEDVIAISGDYATNVANDPFAIYYTPNAVAGEVSAPQTSSSVTIPNSGFSFPDSNFVVGGTQNSPAELIVYFFTPDSSTSRSDDYALFRKINSRKSELVARNLIKTDNADFFEYFYLHTAAGGVKNLRSISGGTLPLSHSVAYHQNPADTGAVALIDSVKAVRVRFTATNGLTGSDEQTRAVTRMIPLPNVGLASRQVCGDEPILGTGIGAVPTLNADGDPIIRLSWTSAVDEGGGENDVIRYVVWKREGVGADWGDPYLSIPSGETNYTYEDGDVETGVIYQYRLAAQDCTPSLSDNTNSALVVGP